MFNHQAQAQVLQVKLDLLEPLEQPALVEHLDSVSLDHQEDPDQWDPWDPQAQVEEDLDQ